MVCSRNRKRTVNGWMIGRVGYVAFWGMSEAPTTVQQPFKGFFLPDFEKAQICVLSPFATMQLWLSKSVE